MLKRDKEMHKHDSCPNRGHCSKDESKCCYLLSNHQCYLNCENSEDFI